MEFIIFIFLIFCIIYLIRRDRKPDNNINVNKSTEQETIQPEKIMLYPYRKKYLLTKTEYYFYNELVKHIISYNLIICPKVRIEDFVEVTDKNNTYKYRGYIKSRHVDFLLCDNKLNILAAIELDDSSHNSMKAQKSDDFKNNLFKTINLKLYRIRTNSNYSQQISNMLDDIYKSDKSDS